MPTHRLETTTSKLLQAWACALLIAGCSSQHSLNPCGAGGQYATAMRSDGVQAYCSYVVIVVGFRGCPEGFPERVDLPGIPVSEPGVVICSTRPIRLDDLPDAVCTTPACLPGDGGIVDAAPEDTGARRLCAEEAIGCAWADGRPPLVPQQRYRWTGRSCDLVTVFSDNFNGGCCADNANAGTGRGCRLYYTSLAACQSEYAGCGDSCGSEICVGDEICVAQYSCSIEGPGRFHCENPSANCTNPATGINCGICNGGNGTVTARHSVACWCTP